jgi:hypothetical protein
VQQEEPPWGRRGLRSHGGTIGGSWRVGAGRSGWPSIGTPATSRRMTGSMTGSVWARRRWPWSSMGGALPIAGCIWSRNSARPSPSRTCWGRGSWRRSCTTSVWGARSTGCTRTTPPLYSLVSRREHASAWAIARRNCMWTRPHWRSVGSMRGRRGTATPRPSPSRMAPRATIAKTASTGCWRWPRAERARFRACCVRWTGMRATSGSWHRPLRRW